MNGALSFIHAIENFLLSSLLYVSLLYLGFLLFKKRLHSFFLVKYRETYDAFLKQKHEIGLEALIEAFRKRGVNTVFSRKVSSHNARYVPNMSLIVLHPNLEENPNSLTALGVFLHEAGHHFLRQRTFFLFPVGYTILTPAGLAAFVSNGKVINVLTGSIQNGNLFIFGLSLFLLGLNMQSYMSCMMRVFEFAEEVCADIFAVWKIFRFKKLSWKGKVKSVQIVLMGTLTYVPSTIDIYVYTIIVSSSTLWLLKKVVGM